MELSKSDNYKHKYVKYKSKYLNLKSQTGTINQINEIVKYLAHCTQDHNIKTIIDSNKLKVSQPGSIWHSKVYMKIFKQNSNQTNLYCLPDNSVELIFDPKILIEEKYYFITNGGTQGELSSAYYLSDAIYKIIKESDYNKKKIIRNIKKKIKNKKVVVTLIDEIDDLMKSPVVVQKRNPSLIEALSNIEDYSTMGFLNDIVISNYITQVAINSKNKSKDELKEFLHNLDVETIIKDYPY